MYFTSFFLTDIGTTNISPSIFFSYCFCFRYYVYARKKTTRTDVEQNKGHRFQASSGALLAESICGSRQRAMHGTRPQLAVEGEGFVARNIKSQHQVGVTSLSHRDLDPTAGTVAPARAHISSVYTQAVFTRTQVSIRIYVESG